MLKYVGSLSISRVARTWPIEMTNWTEWKCSWLHNINSNFFQGVCTSEVPVRQELTALRKMNWSNSTSTLHCMDWCRSTLVCGHVCGLRKGAGCIGRGSTVVGKFDFAKNLNYVFSNTFTLGFPDILKLIIRYLSFTCTSKSYFCPFCECQ